MKFSWAVDGQRGFLRQDARRFVSQKTGDLYIAKVEASDAGNYTCAVRNVMTNATVLSSPTPVVVRRDGKKTFRARTRGVEDDRGRNIFHLFLHRLRLGLILFRTSDVMIDEQWQFLPPKNTIKEGEKKPY